MAVYSLPQQQVVQMHHRHGKVDFLRTQKVIGIQHLCHCHKSVLCSCHWKPKVSSLPEPGQKPITGSASFPSCQLHATRVQSDRFHVQPTRPPQGERLAELRTAELFLQTGNMTEGGTARRVAPGVHLLLQFAFCFRLPGAQGPRSRRK